MKTTVRLVWDDVFAEKDIFVVATTLHAAAPGWSPFGPPRNSQEATDHFASGQDGRGWLGGAVAMRWEGRGPAPKTDIAGPRVFYELPGSIPTRRNKTSDKSRHCSQTTKT